MFRRQFIAGGGASAILTSAAPALAEDKAAVLPIDPIMVINGLPLFKKGEMVENRVAAAFASTPQLTGPFDFDLLGAAGTYNFANLTGKVRLVSLWAEQYWPCLCELNELAELQTAYSDDTFEIIAVLTRSQGGLDYTAARKIMDKVEAQNIPLLLEPKGGKRAAVELATMNAPYPAGHPNAGQPITNTLPCTLIVDKAGRVRGRMLGGKSFLKKRAVRMRWQTPLPADIAGSVPERRPTAWSDKDADALIIALKSGILDHIG